MQGERREAQGGDHGEEGGPARVAQGGHHQQGETAQPPDDGPGPDAAAGRGGGEVGGEARRYGDQEEVEAQPVTEQERAEDSGGQGRPEGGRRYRAGRPRAYARQPGVERGGGGGRPVGRYGRCRPPGYGPGSSARVGTRAGARVTGGRRG
ncbi:hypothetical protein GCM10010273_45900 [Streptomyces lavendulocolor]